MMSRWNKKWMVVVCLVAWVLVVKSLTGCSMNKDDGGKVRDLEFTVATETEIPEELKNIIAQKQMSPFKLTFSDETNLYIAVGYGKQESGGYSISVNELYITDNSIVLDTELVGPGKGEGGTEPSYPYIVIKTELLEEPVIFH